MTIGTSAPGDHTTDMTDSTGNATTDPVSEPKFDVSPADLPPPPPPLDCSERPEVPDGGGCTVRVLNWPWDGPGVGWYAFIYGCTDGKPNVCPGVDSIEVESLLLKCHFCYAKVILAPVCGPDQEREDACCYWAIAEAHSCE